MWQPGANAALPGDTVGSAWLHSHRTVGRRAMTAPAPSPAGHLGIALEEN